MTDNLALIRELIDAGAAVFVAPPCPPTCTRPGHEGQRGTAGSGFDLPAQWQYTRPGSTASLAAYRDGYGVAMLGGYLYDFLDEDTQNDGHVGHERLSAEAAWPERVFGVVATPSGGRHYYLKPLGVRSFDAIATGIDLKAGTPDGGRGFVWLPGTVKRSKTTGELAPYTWIQEPDLSVVEWDELDDASVRLQERALARLKVGQEPVAPARTHSPDETRIFTVEQMRAYLTPSLQRLAAAQLGEVEESANNAAAQLSHFVPEFFTPAQAYGKLLAAAQRALGGTWIDGHNGGWTLDKFQPVLDGRRPLADDWKAKRVDTPADPPSASTPPPEEPVKPAPPALADLPETIEKEEARRIARLVCEHGLELEEVQAYRDALKERAGLSGREFDQIKADAKRKAKAARRAAGEQRGGAELPNPAAPMWVAEALREQLDEHWSWWKGDFYRWTGSRYQVLEESVVRGWLYRATKDAWYTTEDANGEPMTKHWMPTTTKINSLADALGTGVLQHYGDAERCLAVTNGVLDIGARTLSPHTPARFNLYSLPFAYEPDARCPQWLAFLESVLPGDRQAHEMLQEWFGYVVAGRTEHQKMLSLVGPPRSGKGTIARVLEALLGPEAVASPILDKLGTQFGEQSLIGKQLAVMSDVRWKSRNAPDAVPVLLAITGGDSREIDRKGREAWHGYLDVRFMCMSNDAPTFSDASGALAKRMMHIEFTETFLGREDVRLTGRLLGELPGILNWALAGLERLDARGWFVEPDSAKDLVREVAEAASPYRAFLDSDWCTLDPDAKTQVGEVVEAYLKWCERHRRTLDSASVTPASLSRGLKSAEPKLTRARVKVGGGKETVIGGLRVNPQDASGTWLVGNR